MNYLIELFQNHEGKSTDRWMSYINQYERLFNSVRNNPIRLLEIGIQNGGSLEIWIRYFSKASHIVGCDIDPLCLNLQYDDPRIAVVVGDVCSKETEVKIDEISDVWDIIIDDGSHHSRDILDAFVRFFPKISHGGMFIIEDLHCSYWQEFEGGLANPYSALAFFKRLVDIVNFEHWGTELGCKDYLSVFEFHHGLIINEESLKQVHSIEFINSQCVVHKRIAEDNLIGKRIVVGVDEHVTKGSLQYHGTVFNALDQSQNPWSAQTLFNITEPDQRKKLADTLIKREQENNELCDNSSRLHKLINEQEAQIIKLNQRIKKFDDTLIKREQENNELCDNSLRLQKKISEQDAQIISLSQCIKKLDDTLIKREQENNELCSHLSKLQKLINERDAQIVKFIAIQNARVTRLARFIERWLNKILPLGSLRRRLANRIFVLGKSVHQRLKSDVFQVTEKSTLHNNISAGHFLRTVSESQAIAEPMEFATWIFAKEPSHDTLRYQRDQSATYKPEAPLFSVILPVYKISGEILAATIHSVQQQTWLNWELCIVYADYENEDNWALIEHFASNDPRLRTKRLLTNGGISHNSNAALDFALGEFIALLDHDDELTPWALHDMAEAISRQTDIDFLYSDKDSINAIGTLRINPLFKPKWSPEMMYSVNYLTHLNIMRASIVKEIGGWCVETDGAQDWDIFLRVAELSRCVVHVPAIHYHWRIIPGSTSLGIDAKPYAALGQLRTLERRLERLGLDASIMPHPESGFQLIWHRDLQSRVDLILYGEACFDPNKLMKAALHQLVGQLASITVLIDHKATISLPTKLPGGVPLHVLRIESIDAVAIAQAIAIGAASAVVLLDYCALELSLNALQDLSGWVLKHPEIGFASPLILINNDTVVEAGRIVGDDYQSQPLFQGMPLRHWGPHGGPLWYRNVSAGSPGAIAFKRDQFNLSLYSSLSIEKAVVACCIETLSRGFRGVVSPHARIQINKTSFKANSTWHESMRHDPYFHPAFCSVAPLKIS